MHPHIADFLVTDRIDARLDEARRARLARIADEVAEILPNARVMLVTSDTLTSPAKAARVTRSALCTPCWKRRVQPASRTNI